MPEVNFFSDEYQREEVRDDAEFGIYDDSSLAKTTTDSSLYGRSAMVSNPNRKQVIFTPIDHNIVVYDDDGNTLSMCDGMLTSEVERILFFVELKVRSEKGWVSKAVSQLNSTIRIFITNHRLEEWRLKRAYACNSKRPNFMVSHKEEMQRFYNSTGFKLIIDNNIKL